MKNWESDDFEPWEVKELEREVEFLAWQQAASESLARLDKCEKNADNLDTALVDQSAESTDLKPVK